MSRIIPMMFIGLILSACVSQAPAASQAPARGGFKLPTSEEYITACKRGMRPNYDFAELLVKFKSLSEIPFSEQYREKLMQAFGRRMERLAAGERLSRRSKKEKPQPTAEEIAKTREELKSWREALRRGEPITPLVLKSVESRDPDSYLTNGLESEEVLRKRLNDDCTERFYGFMEGLAKTSGEAMKQEGAFEDFKLPTRDEYIAACVSEKKADRISCAMRFNGFMHGFRTALKLIPAIEAVKAKLTLSPHLESSQRHYQPQRHYTPDLWEMFQFSQPYQPQPHQPQPNQQPQLRYNPFSQGWSYEDPGSRLHFNPFQQRWEYGHPQAQPRYNPFSGEWQVK